MKKRLSLLVAILIVSMLAACGKEATVVTTPSPEPTAVATEAPATPTPEPTATNTPAPTPTPEPEITVYFKDVMAEHGLKAGTCLNTTMIGTARYEQMVLENFSSVTMENDMKPDAILDQAESQAKGDIAVHFKGNTVKLLDWAKKNGMAMRGHTLIWHSQTPDWIFHEDFDSSKPLVTREVMLARMESYFKQVFDYLIENDYADMFYAYDVANECWMEDGSMRQSNWLATIGEDYLWQAFNIAQKYAPDNIALFYNDYNEQFKTETLVNFVNSLKDDEGNYIIDGIGFQAHLYTEDDLDQYFETVDALSALGITIELTELDVCLGRYQHYLSTSDENLRVQGQFYYNLVNGLLSRIDAGTLKMDSLTIWGFADRMSWRSEGNPLVFNIALKPKYSYFGITQIKEKSGFTE